MKYGIVIFPSRHVQDIANSFRKRYDTYYSLIPPHITLKRAFELHDRNLDKIVEYLEKVAERTAPFNIDFHKVSHFHPTNNVIYLAIRDETPVQQLHEKCNSSILHDEEAYKYVPHLTIGQDLSNGELHDIYGRLRMKKIDLTTYVDRFHLLYQMENGMWTVYQTFLMKRQA